MSFRQVFLSDPVLYAALFSSEPKEHGNSVYIHTYGKEVHLLNDAPLRQNMCL